MIQRAAFNAGLLALIATAGQLGSVASAQAEGRREQGAYSAGDIVQLMRRNGLKPFTSPRRHGATYEAEGVDAQGQPTHVVVDAVTGDLLWRTHRGVDVPAILFDGPEQQSRRRTHLPVSPHRPASVASPDHAGEPRERPSQGGRQASPVAVHEPAAAHPVAGNAKLVSQHRPMLSSDPLALPGTRTIDVNASEPVHPAADRPAVHPDVSPKPQMQVPVAPLD